MEMPLHALAMQRPVATLASGGSRYELLERLGSALTAEGAYIADLRLFETQPPALIVRAADEVSDESETIRVEAADGEWWYTGWSGRICPADDLIDATHKVKTFVGIRIPAAAKVVHGAGLGNGDAATDRGRPAVFSSCADSGTRSAAVLDRVLSDYRQHVWCLFSFARRRRGGHTESRSSTS